MHAKAASTLKTVSGLWLLTTLLTSCASPPPIVSADTSCDRYKHISADDAQRAAIKANWPLWDSLARQIAAHNDSYDGKCK